MKAYQVKYHTSAKTATLIIMAEDVSELDKQLSQKDRDFKPGNVMSRIFNYEEIPWCEVMVSDLSVWELAIFLNDGPKKYQGQM